MFFVSVVFVNFWDWEVEKEWLQQLTKKEKERAREREGIEIKKKKPSGFNRKRKIVKLEYKFQSQFP